MPDKTKVQAFLGALTQDETADLATKALAMLEDDLAIKTMVEYAASAGVIEKLKIALGHAEAEPEEEDEEEEYQEDEDEDEEEEEEDEEAATNP